jgi:hypothetical protein
VQVNILSNPLKNSDWYNDVIIYLTNLSYVLLTTPRHRGDLCNFVLPSIVFGRALQDGGTWMVSFFTMWTGMSPRGSYTISIQECVVGISLFIPLHTRSCVQC